MRTILRVALAGLLCAAAAGAVLPLAIDVGELGGDSPSWTPVPWTGTLGAIGESDPSFPLFSVGGFETAGYSTAVKFTGPVGDGGLDGLRAAIGTRADRGVAELRARRMKQPTDTPAARLAATRIESQISYLFMSKGEFGRAAEWAERAMADGVGRGADRRLARQPDHPDVPGPRRRPSPPGHRGGEHLRDPPSSRPRPPGRSRSIPPRRGPARSVSSLDNPGRWTRPRTAFRGSFSWDFRRFGRSV